MATSSRAYYTTLDIYLSAYLQLQGLRPRLERKNNKVIFSFPVTNQLYQLLLNYNSNIDVPVADYVVAVKTLRGQMLTFMSAVK